MKDGGQAFPRSGTVVAVQGMSMRQWYKGMALQGLCANGRANCIEQHLPEVIRVAGFLADAMIAEDEEFEKKI